MTKGADTDAAKAWAIQEFLRGPDFTYSTQPQPGSGYQALENFLLVDHLGYCEQFAAAMAMMARMPGSLSRVAVGFLPGEKRDDTWTVTVHNMHAWPELYFAGFGWVRYEPTPASVTGTAPAWTLAGADTPSQEESLATCRRRRRRPSPWRRPTRQRRTDRHRGRDGRLGADSARRGYRTAVLLVLAAPATIRFRRRSARLAGERAPEDQVEDAWPSSRLRHRLRR